MSCCATCSSAARSPTPATTFRTRHRTDNRFDIGPDITYLINRYLSVGAGYVFTKQDSDDNTEEFTRNVVTLRVTAQL